MTTKVKVGVIAANAVDTAQLASAAVETVSIAGNAVVSAKIAANQIITAKIASNAIESGHITSGEVTTAHLADSAITTDKIAANAITLAKITSGTLTADSLADNSITGAKIALNSIDSAELVSGSIDTVHIADSQVTNAKLANSSVTVNSNAVSLGSSITLDTDDIGEGTTNQYFTNARAQGAISGGTGVTVSSGEISIGQDVATSSTPTFGNITTTGYIAGPATFTIDPAALGDNTGTVVIAGNLQVDGTTTTINSTTLTVDDKLVTLASGSINAAAAGGAGIEVDITGATNPSLTYDGTDDEWDINKTLSVTGEIKVSSNARIGTASLGTNSVLDVYGGALQILNTGATAGSTADATLHIKGAEPTQNRLTQMASIGTSQRALNLIASTDSGDANQWWSWGVDSDDEFKILKGTDFSDSNVGIRIDSSGNVGIGTTSTNRKLIVSGSSTTQGTLYAYTNEIHTGTDTNAHVSIRSDNASASGDVLHVRGDGSGNLLTIDKSGTEVLVVNSSGNVGIGTDSPGARLHIQPANSDTLATAIFTRQNNAAGTDGNTFSLRNDAANNFVEMNSGGTNNGGYKFYTGNFSGDPALTIVGAGANSGNVGIGTTSPSHDLHIESANPTLILAHSGSINNANSGRILFAESPSYTTNNAHFEIKYDGAASPNHLYFGSPLDGTTNLFVVARTGNIGIGTSSPQSSLQIEGGRMGIISTSSSWEQLRVANSSVAEAGIAIMNGCTASEFLADDGPSFSNAFTLAINPYGCGTDTLGIAHGNLTDSIWHIDGSGNFGYGPGTDNPVSYYEISKTRPNVNQPSDYELKMSLNTYGYVGSGYKLALLQWLGGDTASAQDNFYAGIGSTALDGVNNSEEGSLDFHVRNGISTTETLAMQIIGKAGTGVAGGGQHGKSVMFPYQGIAIDRVWENYPGISVFNSSDAGTNQGEFRFHGTNSSSAAYPGTSGSDFSVVVRSDGGYATGSDRRRKTNITTIDNALSKVNQLTGKRFQTVNRVEEVQEHLSKNGYKFGFIAQEVEDIIPEAVQYHADEDDGTEGWNSAYAMDYGSVVALLVNAIKEQDVVIQDLKSRIEALEE